MKIPRRKPRLILIDNKTGKKFCTVKFTHEDWNTLVKAINLPKYNGDWQKFVTDALGLAMKDFEDDDNTP